MPKGTYRLVLTYTNVPREEVEHVAQDCTQSGDYPADSYEVEVVEETEDEKPDRLWEGDHPPVALLYEVYENSKYDGTCWYARLARVKLSNGLVVNGDYQVVNEDGTLGPLDEVTEKLVDELWARVQAEKSDELRVYTDNPVVYGPPPRTVKVLGKTYDAEGSYEHVYRDGEKPTSYWELPL